MPAIAAIEETSSCSGSLSSKSEAALGLAARRSWSPAEGSPSIRDSEHCRLAWGRRLGGSVASYGCRPHRASERMLAA